MPPLWRVPVPGHVAQPLKVYVNGVEQQPRTDYVLRRGHLEFERELVAGGKLSLWRWFLGSWGIGDYRRDDVVDVVWKDAAGAQHVEHKLPIVPPEDGGATS